MKEGASSLLRYSLPHDAQVRRISWVVGSVGWLLASAESSCRSQRPADPLSDTPSRLRGGVLILGE